MPLARPRVRPTTRRKKAGRRPVATTVPANTKQPATTVATVAADEPFLVGPKLVAAMLGVPTSWVYAKAEAGGLPSYKVGHYRRFKRSEIEEYLRACRVEKAG